jgi:hypothetical protein
MVDHFTALKKELLPIGVGHKKNPAGTSSKCRRGRSAGGELSGFRL